MRISQILLSKPNLIIHPAIFPPLSADADRPPQTASAGADTVSAGPKRPSMDEMPAICCVYTLRLFSRTLLTAFDALMIPPPPSLRSLGSVQPCLLRSRPGSFIAAGIPRGSQLATGACQSEGEEEEESVSERFHRQTLREWRPAIVFTSPERFRATFLVFCAGSRRRGFHFAGGSEKQTS